ncbi:MAG: hypothetical protein IPJ20_20560 [Flammeovirgaceae bacterium]|nr:hypothetical protein [Flammeovirgaceae bacterium]
MGWTGSRPSKFYDRSTSDGLYDVISFTTGGIRGGKSNGFQPRSFNMGISRKVFEQTGGFKFDRLAEH